MISDADPRISITNIGTGHQLGKDFLVRALALLKDLRGLVVDVNNITDSPTPAAFCIDASTPILEVLSTISSILSKTFRTREADVVEYVRAKCSDKKSFGGLGLTEDSISDELDRNDALFLLEAWLTALNSQDRVKNGPAPVAMKLDTVRPMTLAEKILCHHTVGGCPVEGLKPGDVVRIALDWVMASELSWTVSRTRAPLGSTHDLPMPSSCTKPCKKSAWTQSGGTTASGLLQIMSLTLESTIYRK